MKERVSINTLRLRKAALSMRVFTANNLATMAGVSNQTAQDFLAALREEDPQLLETETLPSLKAGRRAHRYTLTNKGLVFLVNANAPFNLESNEEAFAKDPALQPKLPVPLPQPTHPSFAQQVEAWLAKYLPEFQTFIDQGASALLIKAGEAGAVRFGDRMCPSCTDHIWSADEVENAFDHVFSPLQRDRLHKRGETAYAYKSNDYDAVALCAKLARGRPVLELRFLPRHVPTIGDLHLPPLVDSLSSAKTGLVLVTGLAGGGRSSAIAAMIGNINQKQAAHITTIEEPIYYFHKSQRSFIDQRQIAIDVPDFSPAIQQALADRSSVVVVSDVPDRESLTTILAAATRVLVFCRVDAPSPANAIRKLIGLLPEAEQGSARARLAQALTGIICVVSVPNASGTGDIPAAEVLGWNPKAHEAIVNPERTEFLVEELKKVAAPIEPMATAIYKLRNQGLISEETAERCERIERGAGAHS
jgi:Tfp pilus assembly pilus retraction ATPase PilT